MNHNDWMIYDAYGHTGTLIAEGAVRRGYMPLLSGRSMEMLAVVADQLGLEQTPVDLGNDSQLQTAFEGIDLVLNAAGPFAHTASIIVDACLKTGTSYLDISGEPLVMEAIFARDEIAREREVALIPGVALTSSPPIASSATFPWWCEHDRARAPWRSRHSLSNQWNLEHNHLYRDP
jgi:short subunit dehydrogenase-like uncharacterized protein